MVGDAFGNINPPHTQDSYQPRSSPPLKQRRSIKFQQDSAGMMLESSDAVPKPRPILPLTVDQLDHTEGPNKRKTTSSASSSLYMLNQKSTPPTDKQYYKGLRNSDSGFQGPRQPTLLWEQRPSDYNGGDST
jgi:hypothetical protein